MKRSENNALHLCRNFFHWRRQKFQWKSAWMSCNNMEQGTRRNFLCTERCRLFLFLWGFPSISLIWHDSLTLLFCACRVWLSRSLWAQHQWVEDEKEKSSSLETCLNSQAMHKEWLNLTLRFWSLQSSPEGGLVTVARQFVFVCYSQE